MILVNAKCESNLWKNCSVKYAIFQQIMQICGFNVKKAKLQICHRGGQSKINLPL